MVPNKFKFGHIFMNYEHSRYMNIPVCRLMCIGIGVLVLYLLLTYLPSMLNTCSMNSTIITLCIVCNYDKSLNTLQR